MASLEYLAGYFDGEGCVCMTSNSRSGKSMLLVVKVQTGDQEIVELFAEAFGGSVKKATNMRNSKRQLYSWGVYGAHAQEALRQLVPFLRGKREVAELALIPVFGYRGKRSIPIEELERRTVVATKIQAINNRVTIAAS